MRFPSPLWGSPGSGSPKGRAGGRAGQRGPGGGGGRPQANSGLAGVCSRGCESCSPRGPRFSLCSPSRGLQQRGPNPGKCLFLFSFWLFPSPMPASPQSKQTHSDRNNGVSLFGCWALEAQPLCVLPLSLAGGASQRPRLSPQLAAPEPGRPGPAWAACPAQGTAGTRLPVHRFPALEVAGPPSHLPRGGGLPLCRTPPIQNGHLPHRVPAEGSLKEGPLPAHTGPCAPAGVRSAQPPSGLRTPDSAPCQRQAEAGKARRPWRRGARVSRLLPVLSLSWEGQGVSTDPRMWGKVTPVSRGGSAWSPAPRPA